jgi:hypothetical protein
MHASGTTVDDAPQLALSLAGSEQDARSLYMGCAIQFSGRAGVMEYPCQVVNLSRPSNCLLYLPGVDDLSRNDADGLAKLRASLMFVTRQDTHLLLLSYQFRHQGRTKKPRGACYQYGHRRAPEYPLTEMAFSGQAS